MTTPPQQPDTSSVSSPESKWSKLALQIVAGILIAASTFALTQLWNHWTSRVRVFSYYVNSASAIIRTPELDGKPVQVSVDGKYVDNISTVGIQIFNDTDQDFGDVPITIAFACEEAAVLQTSLKQRPDAPVDGLRRLSQGAVTFEYVVKVANRSDLPIFHAEYAFQGGKAPVPTVAVPMKGIAAAPVDLGKSESRNYWYWFVGSIVGFSTAFLVLLWGFASKVEMLRAQLMDLRGEAGRRGERLDTDENKRQITGHVDDQRDVFAFVLDLAGLSTEASKLRALSRQMHYWSMSDELTQCALLADDPEHVHHLIKALGLLTQYAAIAPDSRRIIYYNIARLHKRLGQDNDVREALARSRAVEDKVIDLRIALNDELKGMIEPREIVGGGQSTN